MIQTLLRIVGIGALYGTAGALVTIVAYNVLQATGFVPPQPRTLDGFVAFLDRIVLTAVVLALAGLVMAGFALRGRSAIVGIAGSMIAAALFVTLVRPPTVSLAGYAATAAFGALVAGTLAKLFGLLRAKRPDRRMEA